MTASSSRCHALTATTPGDGRRLGRLRAQRPYLRVAPRRRRISAVRRDELPRQRGRWTPWRVNTYRVRIGLQDLTENIIDRSHFWTVHDMDPPDDDRFDVTFEGPSMVVDQYIKVTAVSERGSRCSPDRHTCGPGIVAVEVREGPIDMLTYITQTPVDDEITEITLHFSMVALDDEPRPHPSPS